MAGDAPEVFLVDLLDGVTVVDAVEAALADLLDEDGGGVWAAAVSLELLLGVRGEEVDLSFEVERPSGEVDTLLLEVLVLLGTSTFSEAPSSSSSSVDSARPPSAFLSTTSNSASAPLMTSGSISPSLSFSLIVDSL